MTTAEPGRPLKRMFDAVPPRYDLLNRLLTLRLDERWRRQAARICLEDGAVRVLDLCCGTGDLCYHLARQAPPGSEIIGLDYSPGMLELAREKLAPLSGQLAFRFVEGDASAMEFPDASFDAVGIAFAFRNLTWKNPLKDAALAQVLRILRPGGRFVAVETSQPRSRVLRAGFHSYLKTVVAGLGTRISGHGSAYRYLAESARQFYDADEAAAMLEGVGFARVRFERKLDGVAAIHVAIKD